AVQNWFWLLEEPDSDDPVFAAVPHIAQWAAR
ncbi:MAG: hypothetical protein JWN36_2728, partial [Microbacteriaceae bacterium]|nr:hypothetical protein [Microbacteriaceae bacterium]